MVDGDKGGQMSVRSKAGQVSSPADQVAEQGWTIIEGAIEPELVDALTADLDRLEKELGTEPAANAFEGTSTLRTSDLPPHGGPLPEAPVHPHAPPAVETMLDPQCLDSPLSSIPTGQG